MLLRQWGREEVFVPVESAREVVVYGRIIEPGGRWPGDGTKSAHLQPFFRGLSHSK